MLNKFFIILIILATSYNAILAILNYYIITINNNLATIAELTIVFISIIYIYINKNEHKLTRHYFFYGIIICLSCWTFAFNGCFYTRFIHQMLLMTVFVILGTITNEHTIKSTFKIITFIVITVLFIELLYTRIYIEIFHPAYYYFTTRGIAPWGGTGLYNGSVAISDTRFSFGILHTHRLSSIFLEQVSLANYSMVVALYLLGYWKKLSFTEKFLYIFTITMILLGNDTRTGTSIIIILFSGYWIFPKLPKNIQVFITPITILLCFVLFYDPSISLDNWSDDLKGRIGLTLYLLKDIDFSTLIGGNLGVMLSHTQDSGYVYILYCSTFLGLITYWLYTSLLLPQETIASKRLSYGLVIFISANLMIGAAVFTIKIAAPLWIIVGHMCATEKQQEIQA